MVEYDKLWSFLLDLFIELHTIKLEGVQQYYYLVYTYYTMILPCHHYTLTMYSNIIYFKCIKEFFISAKLWRAMILYQDWIKCNNANFHCSKITLIWILKLFDDKSYVEGRTKKYHQWRQSRLKITSAKWDFEASRLEI